MDPTILTVIITSISSILISVGVSVFSYRKTKAEADKTTSEADQIRRKLERGDTADILQFIETTFEVMDCAYGLIHLVDRILRDHPEINGGAKDEIEEKRAHLKEIHQQMKLHFAD